MALAKSIAPPLLNHIFHFIMPFHPPLLVAKLKLIDYLIFKVKLSANIEQL